MAMIDTVIFDMDGVLLDSEKLWRQSEQELLTNLGVPYSLSQANQLKGQVIEQIVQHWYNKYPWQGPSVMDVSQEICNRVMELISQQSTPNKGLLTTLEFLKQNNIKIGLASNSHTDIIQCVVKTLKIEHYFSQIVSAYQVQRPKPFGDVYIHCAHLLNSTADNCLVIEDSYTGATSAKNADMKVVIMPDPLEFDDPKFDFAHYKIQELNQIQTKLSVLFKTNTYSKIHQYDQ